MVCDICNINGGNNKVKILYNGALKVKYLCDDCLVTRRPPFVVEIESLIEPQLPICKKCGKQANHILVSRGNICDTCLKEIRSDIQID